MPSLYRAFFTIVFLVFASRAQATGIGPLDTASLLEQAPLACRVKVLSVRSLPIAAPQIIINGGYYLQDGVATVAVSRVLKGTCPERVTIAVHTQQNGQDGREATRLHPGEWALAFLAPLKGKNADRKVASPEVRKAAKYVFLSPVNGTLKIPAPVKPAPGTETETDPQKRLLDELVQAADNPGATPKMLQHSIAQIGSWAEACNRRHRDAPPFAPPISVTEEPRITALLPRLREKANEPITYALYQLAALRWGVLPTVKDAVRVLSGKPSPPGLWFPIGDQAFSLSGVQHNFVYALRARERRSKSDTFDDAAFCHGALQMPSVQQNTELREEVGALLSVAESPRSIPDAALLLYDQSQTLRYIGVCLLRDLVEHIREKETSGMPYEEYIKQETDLLRHWKTWWEAQSKPYKAF